MSRVIDEENDPEVLRAYLRFTVTEVDRLKKENENLRAKEDERSQQQIATDDALLKLKHRLFGKSSEKRPSTRERDQDENQILVHSTSLIPPPEESEIKKLPEITVDHRMSSEVLADVAEEYGFDRDSEWDELTGFYDESFEVDVVPKKYQKKRHRRWKYRLKAAKGSDSEVIVTAPGPLKVISGSSYSLNFAVEVATDKYLYHLPFERQRRQMEAKDLKITCKTLYSLCSFLSFHFEDLIGRIRTEIFDAWRAVHIDETPWPIGNSRQSDGYMWVLSNAAGSYFRFEPSRGGKIAKELLGSYEGPILTDGYAGYDQFKESKTIKLAHCWAHVRREFADIEQNYPRECDEILSLIGKLFKVEREAKSFEKLKILRRKESRSLIDEIQNWLIETKKSSREESGLMKAVNYAMNRWSGLIKFLKDIRIPLTNNEVERTIRHAVVGRKNSYGSRTINGADVAAVFYTIIESCKKVQLDPRDYMKTIVEMSADGDSPLTPLEYAAKIRTH